MSYVFRRSASGPSAFAALSRPDQLDVDRRGQAEIEDLTDHVRRLEEMTRPGNFAGSFRRICFMYSRVWPLRSRRSETRISASAEPIVAGSA